MNIQLNNTEILILLHALYESYIEMKACFKEHTDEEHRIGMTTSEEIKNLYNNLLEQCKEQGVNLHLDYIRQSPIAGAIFITFISFNLIIFPHFSHTSLVWLCKGMESYKPQT